MSNFIQRAKSFFRTESTHQEDAMEAVIEMVVDNFSPEIRRLKKYQQKLRAPVEYAAKHIIGLIEKIPGPLDVTNPAACDEQLIKPFFLNQKAFKKTLNKDQDLKNFFRQNPPDAFYTLFTMDRRVKGAFSAKMQGEIIVRDIAVRMVNVSEYKFRVPSPTMEDAFETLELGVLQMLANHALKIILEIQARNSELEQLQDELSAKIEFFAFERQRMAVRPEDTRTGTMCKEAHAMLHQIEKELDDNTLTPKFYLAHLCDVLNHPERHISAEPIFMTLDRMNNLIEDSKDDNADQIHVMDFHFPPEQSRSAVFLKCDRKVIQANFEMGE